VRVQQIGTPGFTTYNGSTYPSGSGTNFSFDAVGRLVQTVEIKSVFLAPQSNEAGYRITEASDTSTQTTTTTTYDVENNTIGRTYARTRTVYHPDQGTLSTTNTTPAPLSIAWGPNGHPILVTDPQQTSTMPETLHWDGDITPRDATMPTVTAFTRDISGTVIASTNASGTSGLMPVSPADGSTVGFNSGPNFKASGTLVPQYVRPDGFTLGGLASNGTGVQINGVRAYDPKLQSWTTPDAFEGDVHDPASQQRYMWNRGNPVDYSDPSRYNPGAILVMSGAVITMEAAADVLLAVGVGVGAAYELKRHSNDLKKAGADAIKNSAGIDAENPGLGLQYGEVGKPAVSGGGPGAGKRFGEGVKEGAYGAAGGKCVYGRKTTRGGKGDDASETDHGRARSKGGNNTPDNANNACRRCNRNKGANDPDKMQPA
jgi:RHS repeat-associated protein